MEPNVIETGLTFFGKKVIQVGEFFYVDDQIEVGHDDFVLSESKRFCFYKGCIYILQGSTKEAMEYFPALQTLTQEEIDSAPVFTEDDFVGSAAHSCHHAA
jgi:hypothetical protein